MTDRELMQQWLNDLCGSRLCCVNSMSSRREAERLIDRVIAALRARLAQPEQPSADEIIASHAKRLALELEGVLLECEDTSASSKWWGSAYQAIHNFHDDVDWLYPQDHVSPLGKD